MSDKLPVDKIKKLSELLKEQGLTEIELESEGFKIRVRKEAVSHVHSNGHAPAPVAAAPVAASAAPAADPSLFEVKSPMVGTFYQAGSPDADPFVKVGSSVNSGDTLCIVEAMKLMNELPSEVKGEVKEICVSDGEAISFGQVIMRIKKA